MDGCWSKLVNVVSGHQGSVLGLLLFLLCTSKLFSILENKLIGYADDSTLIAASVVPSPGDGVTVAESLSRDLVKVSEWCNLWGMKLNASKTTTMIVSKSRTMHPQSPALTIGGTVLKESDDIVILGVISDSKLTFEKHLRSVYRAVSQRFGIFRKFCKYSMIDRFLGDALNVFIGSFWGTGTGCTKVLAVTLANGDRIHHDGCSGTL